MENAKEMALRSLGVVSRRKQSTLSSLVDIVSIDKERNVLRRNHFAPSLVVGVEGVLDISPDLRDPVTVEAPYGLGLWACDERRVALVDAVAQSDGVLLLVDWTARDYVLTEVPSLKRLLARTRELVVEPVIDLSTTTQQPRKEEVPHVSA